MLRLALISGLLFLSAALALEPQPRSLNHHTKGLYVRDIHRPSSIHSYGRLVRRSTVDDEDLFPSPASSPMKKRSISSATPLFLLQHEKRSASPVQPSSSPPRGRKRIFGALGAGIAGAIGFAGYEIYHTLHKDSSQPQGQPQQHPKLRLVKRGGFPLPTLSEGEHALSAGEHALSDLEHVGHSSGGSIHSLSGDTWGPDGPMPHINPLSHTSTLAQSTPSRSSRWKTAGVIGAIGTGIAGAIGGASYGFYRALHGGSGSSQKSQQMPSSNPTSNQQPPSCVLKAKSNGCSSSSRPGSPPKNKNNKAQPPRKRGVEWLA